MKRLLGLTLGSVCVLGYKLGLLSIKWMWLGHYLLGSGKPLVLPLHIAQQWNHNLVRCVGPDTYQVRPYPAMLFWLVGTMTVRVCDGTVSGVDVYDFHPQKGQRVVHGQDRTEQWAWSGVEDDPTQVPLGYAMPLVRAMGLGGYIRRRGRYLEFSNELWTVLGGRAFRTILSCNI